jgi:hypothetical protein
LAAALALSCPALAADVVSQAPGQVSVAIYRDRDRAASEIVDPDSEPRGLALVTEERTIDLPAGRSKISFRGVAEGIVPETARIDGLPADVVEYNFDYDLLSPGSLIARSVGRIVTLIRTDQKSGKETAAPAVIRSGPDGVVLETEGKLEPFHCGGPAERLVFDRIPPGLTDTPTLTLIARAREAGRYKVRLSYLAIGFDWSADYVARVAPDGRSLDLTGWITLVNRSGTTFAEAPTSVVAGRWNRVDDDGTDRDAPEAPKVEPHCWPEGQLWTEQVALHARLDKLPQFQPSPYTDQSVGEVVVTGSRIAQMSQLGDYKLYSLPEPTTVAARQTKQVLFLEQSGVPFERVYRVRLDPEDLPDEDEALSPAVILELKNETASGLGKPLPAGTVSVIEAVGPGRLVLAARPKVRDMAVGLPVELELGAAMGVTVAPRKLSETTFGSKDHRRLRMAMEVELSNGKPEAIRLEVVQRRTGEDFRVVSESEGHGVKDGAPMWTFNLAAGERRVLTYTYEGPADD